MGKIGNAHIAFLVDETVTVEKPLGTFVVEKLIQAPDIGEGLFEIEDTRRIVKSGGDRNSVDDTVNADHQPHPFQGIDGMECSRQSPSFTSQAFVVRPFTAVMILAPFGQEDEAFFRIRRGEALNGHPSRIPV